VKSNKGAPGIDGLCLEDFPAYAQLHWEEICQLLRAGKYQPTPVRRVVIPKPGGKGERLLGVPTVLDRLIQQAISQVLTPMFEPEFSEYSFGCRPQRSAHEGIRIVWSERAFEDFKHRLRDLTSRRWRVSMEYRLERISLYLRGWMGYFGISQRYEPIPELDGWLRRRIRMCYWKQWRRPRTRIGNLLKLGTPRQHAFSTGLSRKGYWRLSRTLATQTGMTNAWLALARIAIDS
jgi:hypothetical protein